MQRAVNMTDHETGILAEQKEEETEEDAAKNRSQLARNCVKQVTG